MHPRQCKCHKFMEIFEEMYDVNLDRETRKIIDCYIIGFNKITLRLTLITIFVKCKPFIDAICVSFGLLRLSSKASILGIDVVLLRKLFSNQKICDIG